ncbi:MAG: DUF2975 domain-containing protein [Lachnospiraceae bacterium]|nr:DUF2975 domain-containing protein [Lachnospiraceae bacterium]
MEKSLQKLKNGMRVDTIITLAICIILGIFALANIVETVVCITKDASVFQIELSDTGANQSQEYRLYIEGKEYGVVDYNNYGLYDWDGNTNYKAVTIISKIKETINCLIVESILILLYLILLTVKKGNSPFTKKSVVMLRIMAGLCIALALLSPVIGMVGSFVTFGHYAGKISAMNLYILIMGVVFGLIGEIFKYGIMLQEDSDSIA